MTADLIPATSNGIGVQDGASYHYCPGSDTDDPHPARILIPVGPKPWRCKAHQPPAMDDIPTSPETDPRPGRAAHTAAVLTPGGLAPSTPSKETMTMTSLTRADADRLAERILDAVDRQLPGNRDRMLALLADGNGPVNVTTLDDGRLLVTLSGIPLLDVDPADLRPRLD